MHSPARLRSWLALLLIAGMAAMGLTAAVPGTAFAAANDYIVAFQGPNGNLWYYLDQNGKATDVDTHLVMAFFTRPAVAFTRSGYYVIAFEGAKDHLFLYYPPFKQHIDTRLTMAARTSPSIADNQTVAFTGSNGHVWTYLSSGHDTGLATDLASAGPAISVSDDAIAFESANDRLYVYATGSRHLTRTSLDMARDTSPSIGIYSSEVAFQSNNNKLWWYDGSKGHSTGLDMAPETSPSIDPYFYNSSSSETIAFAAYNASGNNRLWIYNALNNRHVNTGLVMSPESSPCLGALLDSANFKIDNYRAWFAGRTHYLSYYNLNPKSSGRTGAVVDVNSDGVAYAPGVSSEVGG